jgi:DNA (cytosine-5)-methyltransferase 1
LAAYYNEFDPYAAQWLRNLIEAGHIAPGVVDERSIEDVHPSDLRGFTQCHFFAGVGVWSLALRRAGWPDDRPVWTGSCPCQPFSSAGLGAAFEDARHLWPSFAWLIKQCKPPVIFGEQVASKAVEPWVDLVHADVEAMEYAFGAVPFPAAGVGAPHIRDRVYWVAQSEHRGRQAGKSKWPRPSSVVPSGVDGRLADSDSGRRIAGSEGRPSMGHGQTTQSDRCVGGLGNNNNKGLEERISHAGVPGGTSGPGARKAIERAGIHPGTGSAGPVNGQWADADWLFCRDGKWRPVEPGTFPLAHGATARVGRLRAYGNAINLETATEFVAAFLDI